MRRGECQSKDSPPEKHRAMRMKPKPIKIPHHSPCGGYLSRSSSIFAMHRKAREGTVVLVAMASIKFMSCFHGSTSGSV